MPRGMATAIQGTAPSGAGPWLPSTPLVIPPTTAGTPWPLSWTMPERTKQLSGASWGTLEAMSQSECTPTRDCGSSEGASSFLSRLLLVRYCLGRPYSTGVRAAALATVLLMIPGIGVKTDCKRGFDPDSQRA